MGKRELILNNFWWKVTALLIAIAIRVGFHTKEESQLFSTNFRFPFSTRELVSHPITITKPASDNREFRVTPSEVDITLSGDLQKLKKLDPGKVRATVDLTGYKTTNGTAAVTVTAPPEFKIERTVPDEVSVSTVKKLQKSESESSP